MNHPSRTQLRPKGGDGPLYSPQRDLAYVYPNAMREALMALDEARWTPETRLFLTSLGVTEDALAQAVKSLVDAHELMINVDGIGSGHDALTRTGWYQHDIGVRTVIYARLGEVMLGGFFLAIRDITRYGGESAQTRQVADLVAAGRMLLERSLEPKIPRDQDAQLRQILALQSELETCRRALGKAHELSDDTVRKTSAILNENQERAEAIREAFVSVPFRTRLRWAFFPAKFVACLEAIWPSLRLDNGEKGS